MVDIFEPNNTQATAQLIGIGSYNNLTAADDDWYKIDVEPGVVSLSMIPTNGYDANMVLYNSAGQTIAADFSDSTENILYHASFAGTLYLKVVSTSPNAVNYTLSYSKTINASGDDAFENNDSWSKATIINSSNTTLSSLKSFDDDWYKVSLNSGVVGINVSNSALFVEVFNAAGDRVADSINTGSTSLKINVPSTGQYYIGVSGGSGQTYHLGLSSQTAWATTLNYGPIRDASISVFDIDGDGKDEIFVGTSKALDANMNEIRPAGLICLEDTGSVKWSLSFPAISGPDPQTGKTYQTTSVSTSVAFGDLDGDGSIDLVVGVGGDTFGEAGATVVGQPGDKGGVYAVDANGKIKWFHQSLDIIGGTNNTGEGRPDGVYGSPVIFDIDSDGVKEVICTGWDQSLWLLNGQTGVSERNIHLADTIWATPKIADIDANGSFEILVSADISENTHAGTTTGGIFHVISADGTQNIPGFNIPVGNPGYTNLKGKAEVQALWSSPVTGDVDGDGFLEIAYGTGNYFHDTRGSFIKVWNHDGTLKFQLNTQGRTFATPLMGDINGDGLMEIVATTLDGYCYAWDHNGKQLFATASRSFGAVASDPIFSSPIAVDLTGDGKMEILYAQGAQIVILDSSGKQLSSSTQRSMIFEQYKGSVVAKDIDHDGSIDILSGGTTASKDQAVVYRWNSPFTGSGENAVDVRYQFHQSSSNITHFVDRFYTTVLNRDSEPSGQIYWVDSLSSGIRSGADVAKGFVFSQEFTNRNLDNAAFVNTLYAAFFGRPADQGGYNGWMLKLSQGSSRSSVLDGFILSQEFKNLCGNYAIIAAK